MTDFSSTSIDVLICTYRRPEMLVKALDGIERAAAKVSNVRVVVVDNDVHQSARQAVVQWAACANVRVTYLSQPQQNIALTRNMALDNAIAPWIALIDDDEIPEENWLASLLTTATYYKADVVFAPVISDFETGAPEWAKCSPVFLRKRFETGTVVSLKEARTGNVLLRGSRLKTDAFRFDPELGLSGGEDSEFFGRLDSAGYKMVWCNEACVHEKTPLSRTTKSWVLKRAFRVGSVEAYNHRRLARFSKAGIKAIKAAVILAQGAFLALCWAPLSNVRCILAMQRAAFGAGFFYGLVAGPYSEYRDPKARRKISK